MRRILIFATLFTLVAAACAVPTDPALPAPQRTGTEVPPTGQPATPAPTRQMVELSEAELATLARLAEALGLPVDQITVLGFEPVEWPNSCLGISYPNARCAQVITPGYRIRLEVHGAEYEYHTNQDGTAVAAAVPSLSWHREGGVAGFCDDLTVTGFGEARAGSCGHGEPYPAGTLTEAELAQLNEWARKFGAVVIERSDPPVPDAMSIVVTFTGAGSGQPSQAEQQAMVSWAQAVYDRLASDR